MALSNGYDIVKHYSSTKIATPAEATSPLVKRPNKGEQKTFNLLLSDKEQTEIEKKETTKTQDIISAIDNINRLFYGVAGGLRELVRGVKDDEPITKDAVDFGKAIWNGVVNKEQVGSRDIIREISPDWLDKVEENNQFQFLGIDKPWAQMDALSVPTFLVDIALDPLSYAAGVGALAKVVKGGIGIAGKGITAAAGKVIGEAAMKGIAKKADVILAEKILPKFNLMGQFKRTKNVAGETTRTDDLLKTFINDPAKASQKAKDVTLKASLTSQKNDLVSKLMNDDQAAKLGEVEFKVDDATVEAFDQFYAKEIGISVDDLTKYRKVEDIIDKIGSGTLKTADEAVLAKDLNLLIKTSNTSFARAVKSRILDDKSVSQLSRNLAGTEKSATIGMANARLDIAKDLYDESNKKLFGELSAVKKSLKNEMKSVGIMLEGDVVNIGGKLKDFQGKFEDLLKNNLPESAAATRGLLDEIKQRVGSLNKYQVEVTNEVLRRGDTSGRALSKSSGVMRKINSLVKNLEMDIGRQQAGVISGTGAEIMNGMRSTIKTLNGELKNFRKSAFSEIAQLKPSVRAATALNKEIVGEHLTKLTDIQAKKFELQKQFSKEVLQREVTVKKVNKYFNQRTLEYKKAFSKLASNKTTQQLYQKFQAEADDIAKKIVDKELPDELKDTFWAFKKVYNDYRFKLMEKDLIGSGSPYYTPRMMDRDFLEQAGKVIPGVRTSSFGNFKSKRTFQTFKESSEWAEKNGMKLEVDAGIRMLHYVQKAEMSLAKHNFEQGLISRLGYEKITDMSKHDLKSIDYLYRQGQKLWNNPVAEMASDVYGKLLKTTKFMLTIPNPAYQGRNFMGIPFLVAQTAGMRQAFNPSNYIDAFKLMRGKAGEVLTKTGQKLDFNFIRDAVEKSGEFAQSWSRHEFGESGKMALERYSMANPKRWIGESLKYGMIADDFGRYVGLLGGLKKGLSMPEALAGAKKALIDYNLINSPVDKALQGVFGFYTFSRKNLPNQIQNLLKNPHQYAITVRALDRISNRDQLSEEEIGALNNYDSTSFKIFGDVIDGVREYSSLGFLPMEEAYQTLNTLSSGDLHKIIGSRVNPLVGSFLDYYYGENSFYGEAIGNTLPPKYAAIIPEKMQKALGLTPLVRDKWRGGEKVGKETVLSGSQKTIFMIRQFPITSRFIGDLAELTDSISTGKGSTGITRYLTGVKTKDLDVQSRKYQEEMKITKAKREKAKEKGAKVFENSYIPKQYKKQIKDKYYERRREDR